MTTRTPTFFLWLTFAAASLLIAGGCSRTQSAADLSQPALDEASTAESAPAGARVRRPYGKVAVPAELFVDLIHPANTGDPLSILVSASCQVPTSSSLVTLRIPEMGWEPKRTEVLCAGESSDVISESLKHSMPPLPVGRYHFVAVLELTPDREGAQPLVLSESLYLDVRANEMLSSNVSFRQLERVALYRQLQARAVENLSSGSISRTKNMTGGYYEQMTMLNPDLVEREMDRLKATDRDIARQIRALNSSKPDPTSDSGTAARSRQGRPVRETAVPVR